MLLGAVADDLTGATDLALTLVREGMRTIQVVGVPDADTDFGEADAVVVALKSRSIPAAEAVEMSLVSARILLAAGARQLFFKYCSTFDSTDDGNIGPVAAALLTLTGDALAIACPAFPTNKRTVYRGHLFVGDMLLSDSPMKDHPLTPMRDSNLVRVLQRQTDLEVGLVSLDVVAAGTAAIRAALDEARGTHRLVVVDAVSDADLRAIGAAVSECRLVTGGSGIALGLPDNFRASGHLGPRTAEAIKAPPGRAAILAGSSSAMTLRQLAHAEAHGVPILKLDARAIADGRMTPAAAAAWAEAQAAGPPPLITSSAEPAVIQSIQEALGRERAGTMIETFLAETARLLRRSGVSRLVVAGGETSGAVVQALGVRTLAIGQEIDPGVPWTLGRGGGAPIALALKSGNFGGPDFFTRAWDLL